MCKGMRISVVRCGLAYVATTAIIVVHGLYGSVILSINRASMQSVCLLLYECGMYGFSLFK